MLLNQKNADLMTTQDPEILKKLRPKFIEAKAVYIQAQVFVNFLTSVNSTSKEFIEKINKIESLKFYLMEGNKNAFKVNYSTSQEDKIENVKCLYTIPYNKLNLQIGFPKIVEIEAGKIHYTIVEVDRPQSIISIQFKTDEYDIQFGFYRSKAAVSSFDVLNEGEEDEMIAHPTEKMENVFPL